MRNHQLETRLRENRTLGSEGGEGETLPYPDRLSFVGHFGISGTGISGTSISAGHSAIVTDATHDGQ